MHQRSEDTRIYSPFPLNLDVHFRSLMEYTEYLSGGNQGRDTQKFFFPLQPISKGNFRVSRGKLIVEISYTLSFRSWHYPLDGEVPCFCFGFPGFVVLTGHGDSCLLCLALSWQPLRFLLFHLTPTCLLSPLSSWLGSGDTKDSLFLCCGYWSDFTISVLWSNKSDTSTKRKSEGNWKQMSQ